MTMTTYKSPMRRAAEAKRDDTCRWFLLCENPATTTVSHTILGDVPCCARCAAKATASHYTGSTP